MEQSYITLVSVLPPILLIPVLRTIVRVLEFFTVTFVEVENLEFWLLLASCTAPAGIVIATSPPVEKLERAILYLIPSVILLLDKVLETPASVLPPTLTEISLSLSVDITLPLVSVQSIVTLVVWVLDISVGVALTNLHTGLVVSFATA